MNLAGQLEGNIKVRRAMKIRMPVRKKVGEHGKGEAHCSAVEEGIDGV